MTQSLGILRQGFGTKRERDAEKAKLEAETEKKAGIEAQIELLPESEQALARISALDPKIGQGILNVLKRGDDNDKEDIKRETEKGLRQSAFISKQPNFAAKQRELAKFGKEKIANGEDPTRILELLNLDETQLDNALLKQRIMGQDIKALFPKEAKPSTEIGQARKDLQSGFITQAEFDTIKNTPDDLQSSVGKLIGDKQKIIAQFGEGSPQANAIQEAIASESRGEKPSLTDIGGIRKEFTRLSGDFITMRDAIGKVRVAAETPSAAGDLALIFNYMKILDPNSVVRESEFATAQNSAGVPERIRAQYNKVLRGERLSDVSRNDFTSTANRLFDSQLKNQTALEASFSAIAEQQNIDPANVIVDFKGAAEETEETEETAIAEGTTATNPNTGEKLIFRGGQWQAQ